MTFTSPSDDTGVTRTSSSGSVLLSPRSSFTARYLDSNGTELTLPLTAAVIKSNLAAVELTVTIRTPRKLLDGSWGTTTAKQTIALRNLILSR